MNAIATRFTNFVRDFAREEDGAQIIEYALIIAVVSLVLIAGMSQLATTEFEDWIEKVGECLTGNGCTWGPAPGG